MAVVLRKDDSCPLVLIKQQEKEIQGGVVLSEARQPEEGGIHSSQR